MSMPKKPPKTFRILHSADWHLGKLLYGKSRHEEFCAFLDWLLSVIDTHQIDALLLAGDIFDTMNPGSEAQKLYYNFLAQLTKSSCRHVIVTAGNHDSPSLIDAPKALLSVLNIHAIGTPSDEVVVLADDGVAKMMVAPISYLRDKDVRQANFGDSNSKTKAERLAGFYRFYDTAFAKAQTLFARYGRVPVVAMGHFFATGASISASDDGMRDYQEVDDKRMVGGLGEIDVGCLPAFDYVALGHIHKMQQVKSPHIRYSGSPLALGFGEAGKQKHVIIADFTSNAPSIYPLDVPSFRHLVRIKGDLDTIKKALFAISPSERTTWVEISYDGDVCPNLGETIKAWGQQLPHLLVLRVINQSLHTPTKIHALPSDTPLSPLHAIDVVLQNSTHSDEQKKELKALYCQLLTQMQDQDSAQAKDDYENSKT